ncbi:MAG TPA: DeoR/GlpR family DNA-binding transcription regulator [Marmoricola sp.]|nr:DeoR/GlpR family DNA-binding transcription regulator [Marmoricola sp.]
MSQDGTVPRSGTRRRRDDLLELVHGGQVNIEELAARFAVSASTIRRDLAALAGEGRVMRTYGGAVGPHREQSLRTKERQNALEKDAIGRAAATLVGSGDVVLLDAGTTVGRLAWHLRQRDDITVVTNGLSSLLALHDAPRVEVILLGGRLRRPNEAFLGPETDQALRRFRPDVVFLGADGLQADRGVSCPSSEQAVTKEMMAASGRQAWVLADHTKLGADPYPYWAPLGDAGLVTDGDCSPATLDAFRGSGWRVELADGRLGVAG